MKKKLLIGLLVLSMLVVSVACTREASAPEGNGNTPAAETKIDEIKKAGKLVLGTAADYPPYEFHKLIDGKDEIVGFDIEIAKAIAESLGVELEIIDMKFEGLLPALVTDDIDIIVAGMVADEERAKTVDFSIEYYSALQKMVVREADKDKYLGPDDLAGVAVGAQKSTIQEGIALDQFSKSEYIGLSKITDLILELQNKKIEAVILAEPVAAAYVSQNSDLYMPEIVLAQEDGVAVAVNKGNEELVAHVNSVLQKLIDDGEIDKLIKEATELAE